MRFPENIFSLPRTMYYALWRHIRWTFLFSRTEIHTSLVNLLQYALSGHCTRLAQTGLSLLLSGKYNKPRVMELFTVFSSNRYI